MEEEAKWPNKKNYDKLDLEQAKFIFDQAEKYLKEVADSSQIIVNRTITLATITVGLMIALLGYSFNRVKSVECLYEAEFLAGMLATTHLFFLCRKIIENIQAKEYGVPGAEPQKLFVDEFFKDEVEKEKRIIHFYVNEIENTQEKINMNKKTNNERWALFHRSLHNLLYTPLVIVSVYSIIKGLIFLWISFCS